MSGQEIVRRINAVTGSAINPAAAKAILDSLDPVTVNGCQGIDVRQVMSEEVTLLTLVIDGSFSMNEASGAVRSCYNEMISKLAESENAKGILVSTWLFNSEKRPLHGFLPVTELPPFLYTVGGGTALYDTVLASLTGQLSYGQELWEDGAVVKHVIVILSDGDDIDSKQDEDGSKTREVARCLADEGYVLAYVGFGEGHQLNERATRKLAETIGFPHVIASGKNAEGISGLFDKMTKAVIRVSNSTGIQLARDFFAG